MRYEDYPVKERMLRAAQALLAEKQVDDVTSRDIAQRAGVGLGSINYHFGSRDDLMASAVLSRFRIAAEDMRTTDADTEDPKAVLSQQMERMLKLLLRFGDAGRFALRHKMTSRRFGAERHMLKFISRYYEDCATSTLEQRLKAIQLSATAAMAFFNQDEFFRYTDIDLRDPQDLTRFIHTLLDSVLNRQEGAQHENQG